MTQVEVLDAAREGAGGYKVDVTRGERIGRVSSEWFSRPADERYPVAVGSVRRRARPLRAQPDPDRGERGDPGRGEPRRCRAAGVGSAGLRSAGRADPLELRPARGLVGAPAAYLRQLPAPLAGINLQYGLTSHRAEQVKTLEVG